MSDAHFQLKTAPPRLGRAIAARPRLEQRWSEVCERTAIVVTAPQGFGKTTLLAQWRRRWLEKGAFVAWASLDALDDRTRFVNLLLFALRAATGKESFSAAAIRGQMESNRELDALTALLAEVAALATPVVIILDDAHRMPQATMREMLAYLLNNAPPNLQFLIGSRRQLELDLTELVAAGRMAAFGVGDLRMSLEESLEILRLRFGNRIGLDDAVHLHDLMEGWPVGLQLAAASIESAADLHAMIGQLSARGGNLQRWFFESLVSRLPPEESAFLVRISILEAVSLELCEAVTGCRESGSYLRRLADESPVVTEGEGRDWLRLHALARDFLLGQFDRLPTEERRACYERAAAWYADHGQYQEAARHALAAGDESLAVAYVSQCLADIAREGRLAEAHDWIKRLPASALARDVRLQMTAAWITALGEDAAAVPGLIQQIERHPQFNAEGRFDVALIAASVGVFRDKPGDVADALRDWDSAPPGAMPLNVMSLANSQAVLALHSGENEQVRRRLLTSVSIDRREPGTRLPLGFADLLVGLSHLMDGNSGQAVSVLQGRLEQAEGEAGRRSPVAAMLAGALAAARSVRGESEQALAALADRLDVIERVGMPDPTMLAYRSLAAIAMRRGEEARALEILAALYQFGVTRDLPRVLLVSLTEQVRLHSLQGRAETAFELLAQVDSLRTVFDTPAYQPFDWLYRRTRSIAAGYACLARSDLDGAEQALRSAADVPLHARRAPMVLVARALLALVMHERRRPEAREMLAEVLSLADLGGIRSFVEAAHPRLAVLEGMVPSHLAEETHAAAPASPARRVLAGPLPKTGGLLTPKEARILSLLATGKANKEIARAMDVGEQTVKWHLKNVFFKLNAASRKHAVDRARLLGLIEG
jgi:LuxR family maltose regulon positive regulatory protein